MFNKKANECLVELLKDDVLKINYDYNSANCKYCWMIYIQTINNFTTEHSYDYLCNAEEIVDFYNYNKIHPYWGKLFYLRDKKGLIFNTITENLLKNEKHLINLEEYENY